MPDPIDTPPAGLLISRDLFFNSKITGTAQALGHPFRVAGTQARALEVLSSSPPRLVLIDLASGDAASADAIASYRATSPSTSFVAFGSHVDADSLASARSAGCDEVMPRSKFSASLPDLLQRYLSTTG